MCFGISGEEDHDRNRYEKWIFLARQYSDRSDFLPILFKFIQENSKGGGSGGRGNAEITKPLYPNLGASGEAGIQIKPIHPTADNRVPQQQPTHINRATNNQYNEKKGGTNSKNGYEPTEEDIDS